MNNRIDILRVPPAPLNTPMFVYYTKTDIQIQLFRDRALTKRIAQPIHMQIYNINFYVEENVRIDIKMVNKIYSNGFLLIEDQLMINQDTYLDRIFTLEDTSSVVDSDGNLLVGEL